MTKLDYKPQLCVSHLPSLQAVPLGQPENRDYSPVLLHRLIHFVFKLDPFFLLCSHVKCKLHVSEAIQNHSGRNFLKKFKGAKEFFPWVLVKVFLCSSNFTW